MKLDHVFKNLHHNSLESRYVLESLFEPTKSRQSLTDPYIPKQQLLKDIVEAAGKLSFIRDKVSLEFRTSTDLQSQFNGGLASIEVSLVQALLKAGCQIGLPKSKACMACHCIAHPIPLHTSRGLPAEVSCESNCVLTAGLVALVESFELPPTHPAASLIRKKRHQRG
jgi:hypothetical protein